MVISGHSSIKPLDLSLCCCCCCCAAAAAVVAAAVLLRQTDRIIHPSTRKSEEKRANKQVKTIFCIQNKRNEIEESMTSYKHHASMGYVESPRMT